MESFNISYILTSIVEYIDVIVGGNEFAVGAILAGLMGIVTYISRSLPLTLWKQCLKHTTTTLELNSTNESYHNLSKYLYKNGFADKSRYIKVGNGRWGYDQNIKQIGYGKQIFWVNCHTPILVNNYKEESDSSTIKEFIILTKLGRNHLFFNNMIDNINKTNEDPNVTKIYEYIDNCERLIISQQKRKINSVILSEKIKQDLLTSINAFVSKEDWYVKHQIPYQFGILLYGPPGTGKTSLIKAIASYMNKDICYVNGEESLISAAQKVKDTIIVVEEIDTFGLEKRNDDSSDDEMVNMIRSFDKRKLGKILNALDGIISNHGRIIIMTTNHKDVIDSALIRPGRIDVQVKVDYICSETFNSLLKRFFPKYQKRDITVKNNISPVVIQNDIILGLNPDELIEKYSSKMEIPILGSSDKC